MTTSVDERPSTGSGPAPRRANPLWALARNAWRQLTSMRTALVLLFLLAVAAIPGSLLPQTNVSPEKVREYFQDNPGIAPTLDRLGLFDVFASVWFSAIYVLLFTSLIGCITPRLRDHVRNLRTPPPAGPKRLDRLPRHHVLTEDELTGLRATAGGNGSTGIGTGTGTGTGNGESGEVAAIAAVLRQRRWRVTVRGNTVAAEKGYLKESGNLLFHTALLLMLLGVALGSWYGWHGNRLLVAGPDNSFCSSLDQFAESKLGPRVQAPDLPRFCLELTDFHARYLETGQAEAFNATVNVDQDNGPERSAEFSVNSPLRLDRANVYLLGHGYAPVLRYTDRNGKAQTTVAPFLTKDSNLTSEGAAAFPDVNFDPATGERNPNLQVGFEGIYLPTAPPEAPFVSSDFPAERNPALMLFAYRGNLGVDAGVPGSVYTLNQDQINEGKLLPVGDPKLLRPGEAWTLDDGTTVEFLGTRQYVTLSVRYDPASALMLVSSVLLLVGLMGTLFVRRRRVWFRVTPAGTGSGGTAGPARADADPADGSTTGGSSLIEAGGLPRTDYAGFADEFNQLVAAVGRGAARREGTE